MSNSTLSDDCAGEILDSGFLVQWEGINPGTGETRKPVWVSRDECPAEMVARWEARIKLKSDATQQTNKRSASPSIALDSQVAVRSKSGKPQKKPKLAGKVEVGRDNRASGNAGYPGFRPFHRKPKTTAGACKSAETRNEPIHVAVQNTDPLASCTDNTVNSGDHWLLDPVVLTKNGMTVVLAGTRGGPGGNGWYNGDYEAERGVVLSVFNTGNSVFSSTAQVKMLEARAGAPSSFVVPVEFLEPVRPDRPSQKALVLDGECKGEVAVVREEGSFEGEWFVSVRHNYFEISGEKLVLYHEL